MAIEFDPRRNIPPPEWAELTPIEKARKKIEEHLKTAKLKSIRFQAFEDFTGVQLAESYLNEYGFTQALKTIDQRMSRSFRGRKHTREYEEIDKIASDYRRELTQEISDPREKPYRFAQGLLSIREEEIARRSQQSQTPDLFTWISRRFTR
jgi:hypothetical protein